MALSRFPDEVAISTKVASWSFEPWGRKITSENENSPCALAERMRSPTMTSERGLETPVSRVTVSEPEKHDALLSEAGGAGDGHATATEVGVFG